MISELHEKIRSCILNKEHTEWKYKTLTNVCDLLQGILPHGSGIDCDWEIADKEQFLHFECKNSWHAMDQQGGYCGYVKFTVSLDLSGPIPDWSIDINSADVQAIDASFTQEENEHGETETNAPCLDDLDEVIHQAIDAAFNWYWMEQAVIEIARSPYWVNRVNQTDLLQG